MFDITQLEHAIDIKDGDELRNINSFEYLKNIAKQIPDSLTGINSLSYLRDFFKADNTYIQHYPYGDMYTHFLLLFENDIQQLDIKIQQIQFEISMKKEQTTNLAGYLESNTAEEFTSSFRVMIKHNKAKINELEKMLSSIDSIIDSVYANPNKALERSAKMIDEITQNGPSHTSSKIESSIRSRLLGKNETLVDKFKNQVNYVTSYRDINTTTPQQEGSNTGRLKSMISSTFKPQSTTSLASIRTYDYKKDLNLPTEYRFGTQGQYHDNQARISPLFKSWLMMKQRKRESETSPVNVSKTRITHIYFNNLGLDRSDYEGKREKKLTEQLHHLEHEHTNIAVITLPADKGLMDKKLLKNHLQSISINDAKMRMRSIAIGTTTTDDDPDPIKDFYISNDIKKLLYGEDNNGRYDKEKESEIINKLLDKSFEKSGFLNLSQNMSPAEMQSVYFHFIKYELTNFIIEKLNPESFNMSCKDAIDRGGVSSAYYNLLKSLELGQPLSRDEFNRALHAAPTLVKGRGMNHHTKLIWNAIDAYLNAQNEKPANIQWLDEWRNNNAPTGSRSHLISKLESYIKTRGEDKRIHHSIFGKFDRFTKLKAAEKLLYLIKNPQDDIQKEIYFTPNEWAALHQGNLSKSYKEIEKNGVIDLSPYEPKEKITIKLKR